MILGKSLICKEKCIQVDEKERNSVEQGMKSVADPVFFISMVGLAYDRFGDMISGIVHEHEYLFDIYTRIYDFVGTNVRVLSAQDLLTFYLSKNKSANREDVDIYKLVEFFIQHHSNGHFILDECPFLKPNYSK